MSRPAIGGWCMRLPVGAGWRGCRWAGIWGWGGWLRPALVVVATASRGKCDPWRARGFDEDHISDSRTCEFEDKSRALTGGRGVDVVLDSLAGEFVDASLRLVVP